MVSVPSPGSIRSALSAGLAAGVVAAAGFAVVSPAAVAPLPALASPAVQLSAVVASLPLPAAAAPTPPVVQIPSLGGSAGNAIINTYNAIQPWAQYGVQLGAWAVGWLPWPIGLVAPQMNIAYYGIEPVVQASVYSFAYLLDGYVDLIVPTLTNGVQTGFNNFVQGEISWLASFFPPLPPINFPVLPGAATPLAAPSAAPAPAATAAPEAGTPVVTDPAPVVEPVAQPAEAPVRRGVTRVHPSTPGSAAPAAAAAEAPSVEAPAVEAQPDSAHRPARTVRANPGARDGAENSPAAASSTKAARAARS